MNQALSEQPVLIVDDEKSWLKSVSLFLERSLDLVNIRTCQDSREAMAMLAQEPASLILLDVTMPHLSGEDLLQQIKAEYPETPVLMLSGRNEVDIAVRCTRYGAFDYFVKTVDEERLLNGVRHALGLYALHVENMELKQSLFCDRVRHPQLFSQIITRSPKMMTVFRYLEAIAHSGEPVLITGESGVGKELVARAVHRLSSPQGPWVAVNVAGLDDQVFSDTLFGHTRGAFTDARESRTGMIEQARHGVLFLDEIGDLSQTSQVKLLRLLQEEEYLPLGSDLPKMAQTRFVFATNHDLPAKVAQGTFRRDLYYRLKTHQVHIPPLRERREDLPFLLEHFLHEAAGHMGKKAPTVPEQLLSLLQNALFPGNVREFRAMVFDAVARHQHGVLSMASFHDAIAACRGEFAQQAASLPTATSHFAPVFPEVLPTLKEMANLLVDEALRRTEGNQTQAARLLGVTRAALGKRLKGRMQGGNDKSALR